MSDCVRCLRIHGEGRKACYRDEETGEELCPFCMDGFLCPTQKRILEKAKAAGTVVHCSGVGRAGCRAPGAGAWQFGYQIGDVY